MLGKKVKNAIHAGGHVCMACTEKTGAFWHLVSDHGVTYCLCFKHALKLFRKEAPDVQSVDESGGQPDRAH